MIDPKSERPKAIAAVLTTYDTIATANGRSLSISAIRIGRGQFLEIASTTPEGKTYAIRIERQLLPRVVAAIEEHLRQTTDDAGHR